MYIFEYRSRRVVLVRIGDRKCTLATRRTAFLREISLHVFIDFSIDFSWKLNVIAAQHGSMNSIH